MARIKTGSIVGDIAGKVGDQVYSRNKYGPYVKSYSSPSYFSTDAALLQRSYFSQAVTSFNNLSDSYYNSLTTFCKSLRKSSFNGSFVRLNPRDVFISMRMNLLNLGNTNLPVLRPSIIEGSFDIQLVSNSSDTLQFIFNGVAYPNEFGVILSASAPQPLSVRSPNSKPQSLFFTYLNPQDNSPNVIGNYLSHFDLLSIPFDSRIFFTVKVVNFQNGLLISTFRFVLPTYAPPPSGSIGNDDIRSSLFGITYPFFLPVNSGSGGTVSGLFAYVESYGGDLLAAIYTDSSSKPSARIAFTGDVFISSQIGWVYLPFIEPVLIGPNMPLWLALSSYGDVEVYSDASPIEGVISEDYVSDLPPSVSGVFFQSVGASLYYTYD